MQSMRQLVTMTQLVTLMVLATAGMAAQDGPVYRPGRGVALPEVVKQVRAYHTPEAVQQRIEGIVRLEAIVEADGRVGDVTVSSSLDSRFGLDQQAIDAVKQWAFKPATYQGKPVAAVITIQMRFSLI